jgi:hypothetical protein
MPSGVTEAMTGGFRDEVAAAFLVFLVVGGLGICSLTSSTNSAGAIAVRIEGWDSVVTVAFLVRGVRFVGALVSIVCFTKGVV